MNKNRLWIILGLVWAAGSAIVWYFAIPAEKSAQHAHERRGSSGRPVPVQAVPVRSGDIEVVINGLGTVVARNTTVVRARVDGQLVRIAFREGQMVKAGELLAEIDRRPFQVQLDQASGQLVRDKALLANAHLNVERYQDLLAKDFIAKQQVDAQETLVRQYEGTVQADQAQVDNARLQLDFARISAPVAGRLGLRQIDVGNMIHSSDANGLVVITQTQPIAVVFTTPADNLTTVLGHIQHKEVLKVDAFDRDGKTRLATGELLTVDNQIDTATGTVKLKAEFANVDNRLFPNQFVNASLHVETRHDAVLVPLAAIQRGAQGTFVYVVDAEQTAQVRPVALGLVSGDQVAIASGLTPGESVVTDGVDKLRDGAKVEMVVPDNRGFKRSDGGDKEQSGRSENRHKKASAPNIDGGSGDKGKTKADKGSA